jgi:hypothetical protein
MVVILSAAKNSALSQLQGLALVLFVTLSIAKGLAPKFQCEILRSQAPSG